MLRARFIESVFRPAQAFAAIQERMPWLPLSKTRGSSAWTHRQRLRIHRKPLRRMLVTQFPQMEALKLARPVARACLAPTGLTQGKPMCNRQMVFLSNTIQPLNGYPVGAAYAHVALHHLL